MVRAIIATRLVFGDRMSVQAPPNLTPVTYGRYLDAGINDWGGISPLTRDYVNPEAPWPHVAQLAVTCAEEGYELRPRLPIYPEYVDRPGFLHPALRGVVREALEALTGDTRAGASDHTPELGVVA